MERKEIIKSANNVCEEITDLLNQFTEDTGHVIKIDQHINDIHVSGVNGAVERLQYVVVEEIIF